MSGMCLSLTHSIAKIVAFSPGGKGEKAVENRLDINQLFSALSGAIWLAALGREPACREARIAEHRVCKDIQGWVPCVAVSRFGMGCLDTLLIPSKNYSKERF